MECFKRFRNIDSHFARQQILKDFERSNHKRVKDQVDTKYGLYISINQVMETIAILGILGMSVVQNI